MYELLGLVKDGKAPKKIKYKDKIWKYIKSDKEYLDTSNYIDALFSCFIDGEYILNLINNEVEIIENQNIVDWPELHLEILKNTELTLAELKSQVVGIMKTQNEIIHKINKIKETNQNMKIPKLVASGIIQDQTLFGLNEKEKPLVDIFGKKILKFTKGLKIEE